MEKYVLVLSVGYLQAVAISVKCLDPVIAAAILRVKWNIPRFPQGGPGLGRAGINLQFLFGSRGVNDSP